MIGLIQSLRPIWEKYKIEVVLITVSLIITLSSGLIFSLNQKKTVKDELPKLIKNKPVTVNNRILVDLSGAVEKSDVYEVSSGARLKDILILAGGLSQDADRQFFSKNFNLARVLKDQEKIYIPNTEETDDGIIQPFSTFSEIGNSDILGASVKVNINLATSEQLDNLPGIGSVTALKIIQGRPYRSLEDLLNKKSVGKAVFEKIKDQITF